MKTIQKVFKINVLAAMLLLAASACTDVYYEKPVPQGGDALQRVPADWAGTYIVEPNAGEEVPLMEQIFRTSLSFDLPAEGQLLVSIGSRVYARDLPRLREALDEQMRTGALLEYRLSENMLFLKMKSEESGGVGYETQYSPLIRQGDWYVLARSVAPFRLYDMKAGRMIEYEPERHQLLQKNLVPEADSLSLKPAQLLVARQKDQAGYLNTRGEADAYWSMVYIRPEGRDRLLIKMSNLDSSEDFEKREAYFNGITPFRKDAENKYLINPDDRALDRLLAESQLFQEVHLRRIGQ